MPTEGKKVRIKVRTIHSTYIGDILLPAMRNRVSDYFNDDKYMFLNLTDVKVDNARDQLEFVCPNKQRIESIALACRRRGVRPAARTPRPPRAASGRSRPYL